MNLETAINIFASDLDNAVQRHQAGLFFENQIVTNQLFYKDLFNFYIMKSSNYKQQKWTFFLLNLLIKKNFSVVKHNIHPFLEGFKAIIQNTENIQFFLYLSDITIQIIDKNHEFVGVTDTLKKFYTLYQDQDSLVPYCIYLLSNSVKIIDKLSDFKETIMGILPEILLKGLENAEPKIKIQSCSILTKMVNFENSKSIPEEYRKHLDIVIQFTRESEDLSNESFKELWEIMKNIKKSLPLFEIAHNFLNSEKLNEQNKDLLYQFICLNAEFIKQEDIEAILSGYFELYLHLFISENEEEEEEEKKEDSEENEKSTPIFNRLSRINRQKAYEFLKEKTIIFLSSEDLSKQIIGIDMLAGMLIIFSRQDVKGKSELISMSLKVVKNSHKNIVRWLDIMFKYINIDQFNIYDSISIADCLIEIFIENFQNMGLFAFISYFLC